MSLTIIQSRLFCTSKHRLATGFALRINLSFPQAKQKKKVLYEFSTSQAKEKSSLEIEFDKKLTDERQKAIEDINTKILNNEKSLIQITPRMWTLAIENNPAISDFVKSIRPQMGIKNRIFDL